MAADSGLGTLGQQVATKLRVLDAKRVACRFPDGTWQDMDVPRRFQRCQEAVDGANVQEVQGFDKGGHRLWIWTRMPDQAPQAQAQDQAPQPDVQAPQAAAQAPAAPAPPQAPPAAAPAALAPSAAALSALGRQAPAYAPALAMAADSATMPAMEGPATWQTLHALDTLGAVQAFRTLQAVYAGAALGADAQKTALDAVTAHNRTLMAAVDSLSQTVRVLQNENSRLRGQLAQRPIIVQEVDQVEDRTPDAAATGIGQTIGDVATAALERMGQNLLGVSNDEAKKP